MNRFPRTLGAIVGAILLAAGVAFAQAPAIRWNVETTSPQEKALDIWRGETVTLEPTLLSNGSAISLAGVTNVLWLVQPGGTGAYQIAAAGVTSSTPGRVSITVTNTVFSWNSGKFRVLVQSASVSNLRTFGTVKVAGPTGTGGYATMAAMSGPWAALIDAAEAALLASNTLARAATAAAATNLQAAITAEANTRATGDTVARTNLQAVITAHTSRTDNPHSVTAAQVGALTIAQANASNAADRVWVTGTWAATGTISRATAAAMLSVSGAESWIEYEGSQAVLVRVTNSTSVYVVSTNGAGYSGPVVGTIWSSPQVDDFGVWFWPESGGKGLYHNPETILWSIGTYPDSPNWERFGSLPLALSGVTEETNVTLDWVPLTNRYNIATQEGTVILIGQHNTDAAAHPTLPRYANVTNVAGYVAGATNAAHAAVMASAGALGHVRVGSGLSIDGSGVLAATGGNDGSGVTHTNMAYAAALTLDGATANSLGITNALAGNLALTITNLTAGVAHNVYMRADGSARTVTLLLTPAKGEYYYGCAPTNIFAVAASQACSLTATYNGASYHVARAAGVAR